MKDTFELFKIAFTILFSKLLFSKINVTIDSVAKPTQIIVLHSTVINFEIIFFQEIIGIISSSTDCFPDKSLLYLFIPSINGNIPMKIAKIKYRIMVIIDEIPHFDIQSSFQRIILRYHYSIKSS